MTVAAKKPGKRTAKGTFAKGVSGNPGGRPKAQREWLEQWAQIVTPADFKAVSKKLIAKARAGDRWAVELFMARCLGAVPRSEALEVETEEGRVVSITYRVDPECGAGRCADD